MDELSDEKYRLSFEAELDSLYAGRTGKPRWSRERILEIMKILEEYKSAAELNIVRNSTHYHYWRNYEIYEELGQDILITRRKLETDPAVRIVPSEEYYDVLTQVHDATGHGGRDKMIQALKNNCSIPTPVIRVYLNHCGICKIKKENALKNRRNYCSAVQKNGLMTLIDKQSNPDGNFKWILSYQDSVSKFFHLRPLTTNSVSEVALELLKIFLEVGFPDVLVHSNLEFVTETIEELKKFLSTNTKIVGVVPKLESDDNTIEFLLNTWMKKRNSSNWSLGLYFVQYQKNTNMIDPVLDKTPFRALFGVDARVDMISDEDTVKEEFDIDIKIENIE